MSSESYVPAKKEVMVALLEEAEAQVHLDGRHPDVKLPLRLKQSGHVRLDYGYGLDPAIPDLDVTDEGIWATLSFNRVPTQTFVPWSAVYLIADFSGRGAVWRGDIPADVAVTGTEGDDDEPKAHPAPRIPQPRPEPRASHLKLVK